MSDGDPSLCAAIGALRLVDDEVLRGGLVFCVIMEVIS